MALSSPHPLNPEDAGVLPESRHKGYRGCLWDPPRHELEEGLQWVVERQRAGEAAEKGDREWGPSPPSLSPTTSEAQGLVHSHLILAASFWNVTFSLLSIVASSHPLWWQGGHGRIFTTHTG